MTRSIVELHKIPRAQADLLSLHRCRRARLVPGQAIREALAAAASARPRGFYYLLYDFLKFEIALARRIRAELTRPISTRRSCLSAASTLIKEGDDRLRGTGAQGAWHRPRLGSNKDVRHFTGRSRSTPWRTSRISGLVNFSCFPQTDFHDEYLFLRVIHISELCFYGIRSCIVETIESLRRGNKAGAVLCH